MPLDIGGLTTTLEDLFASGASTALLAGDAWADAIGVFAQSGAANGVPSSVPAPAVATLASALAAQFAIVPGTAASCASGIVAALTAFWPLVLFAGQLAPAVPTGGPALQAALIATFSVPGGTYQSKAAEIANALLAYTILVIVTFPPGNPFPVT